MSRAATLNRTETTLKASARRAVVTCGPILARLLKTLQEGKLEALELSGGEVVTLDQLHDARLALLKLAQDAE